MGASAIIFDCDGTLVDTEMMSARIDVAYFAQYGVVYKNPQDYLNEFMGVAKGPVIDALNAKHGVNIPTDIFEAYFAREMIARIPQEMRFFPESLALVRKLAARGVKMGVASNGQREAVVEELRVGGYLDFIANDNVFGVKDAPNPKPAPDLYLAAAAKLGVVPADCLVVEDSVPGAQGGMAAGMQVIGYTGLSAHPEKAFHDLKAAGCVNIVSDLSQIERFLAL